MIHATEVGSTIPHIASDALTARFLPPETTIALLAISLDNCYVVTVNLYLG